MLFVNVVVFHHIQTMIKALFILNQQIHLQKVSIQIFKNVSNTVLQIRMHRLGHTMVKFTVTTTQCMAMDVNFNLQKVHLQKVILMVQKNGWMIYLFPIGLIVQHVWLLLILHSTLQMSICLYLHDLWLNRHQQVV